MVIVETKPTVFVTHTKIKGKAVLKAKVFLILPVQYFLDAFFMFNFLMKGLKQFKTC